MKERQIILSKVKYGEADLILKVINAEGEVYSVIAKSALKSKKRFGGGVLEPTHHIIGTIVKRALDEGSGRMSVLTEAQLIDDFRGIKGDYDRLSLALHFVRTVGIISREGDNHREIFNLLGHALKAAEVTEHLSHLKLRFDLKLLYQQGVLPHDRRFAPFISIPIRENLPTNIQPTEIHKITQETDHLLNNYLL